MFDSQTVQAVITIAEEIGVPPAALMAVVEVESGGRVLADVNGRQEPLIRFEGHYFDRLLRGKARAHARKQKLASPIAGCVRNPRSQAARWKKLEKAIAINRVAALSSCSWGLGQVMGSHWKWLGYGSVDAMVAEARSGVRGQVRLMARFIEKSGLVVALCQQDWRTFARRYNGPAYAKNRYDKKMETAFVRHLKALEKHLPPVEPAQAGTLLFGSRGAEVKRLQKRLAQLGYMLRPDGIFGLVTDRTVRAFQRDHGLDETGIVARKERMLLASGAGTLARNALEARKSVSVALRKGSGRRARQKLRQTSAGIKTTATRLKQGLLSLFRRFA